MKTLRGIWLGALLVVWTHPAPGAISAKDAWRDIDRIARELPGLVQQQDQKSESQGKSQLLPGREEDHSVTNQLALLMLRLEWFIKEFPDDRRVMEARAWWVQTAPQVSEGLGTPLNQDRFAGEIALLETAHGLAPQVEVEVDYALIRVNLLKYADKGLAVADFERLVSQMGDFFKKFPRDWRAAGIAYSLGQLVQNRDEARARVAYGFAAHSPDQEMAANAEREMAALPYRHHPLDLAFTATDGRRIDLASLKGRIVVIDYWATWCPPCRDEAPEMAALYLKFRDRGVEFIGISLDEDKRKLAQFAAKNGLVWAQYFDGAGWDNKWVRRFAIHSIPTVWVLGTDGRIVSTDARGNVEKIVNWLLARQNNAAAPIPSETSGTPAQPAGT